MVKVGALCRIYGSKFGAPLLPVNKGKNLYPAFLADYAQLDPTLISGLYSATSIMINAVTYEGQNPNDRNQLLHTEDINKNRYAHITRNVRQTDINFPCCTDRPNCANIYFNTLAIDAATFDVDMIKPNWYRRSIPGWRTEPLEQNKIDVFNDYNPFDVADTVIRTVDNHLVNLTNQEESPRKGICGSQHYPIGPETSDSNTPILELHFIRPESPEGINLMPKYSIRGAILYPYAVGTGIHTGLGFFEQNPFVVVRGPQLGMANSQLVNGRNPLIDGLLTGLHSMFTTGGFNINVSSITYQDENLIMSYHLGPSGSVYGVFGMSEQNGLKYGQISEIMKRQTQQRRILNNADKRLMQMQPEVFAAIENWITGTPAPQIEAILPRISAALDNIARRFNIS